MTTPTPPGRGGRRANSGRRRVISDAAPAVTYSIRLPADTVDALRALRTLDVRWVLDQLAREPTATINTLARRRQRKRPPPD